MIRSDVCFKPVTSVLFTAEVFGVLFTDAHHLSRELKIAKKIIYKLILTENRHHQVFVHFII